MKFTEKMATLLIGASLLATAAAEAAEWNFATTSTIDSHYGAAQQAFKEKIEALSNGDIIVNLKPNGVLGGEREVLEGMQIGTIELALTSTGAVGNFVPEVYALDFPFLFKDYASARAVLDGEIGQSLLDKFDAIGLEALAWGENGFRHVTNSQHPVKTPEDLAGLKLRTMENQVHIAAFEAAGAAPDPDELDRGSDRAAAGHHRRTGEPDPDPRRQQDLGRADICDPDRPRLFAGGAGTCPRSPGTV